MLALVTFVAYATSWQLASFAGAPVGRASSDVALRAAPAGRGLALGTRASSSIEIPGTRAGVDGRTLMVSLGLPLTVVDGGAAVALRAPRGASVTEALDLAGVRLGPLDRVLARDDAPIAPGDVIRVVRVTESDAVLQELVPFTVTTVADASLIVGRTFVVTPGEPGLALNTYRVRSIDGAEVERLQVVSAELRAPVAEVRHVGTRVPPGASEIESIIRGAAADWGADADQLLRVAWCESRYNPSAYNAASAASGLFQFLPRTWAANSARAGYGGASVFDPVANANTAAYMFANQQARQWACK